MKASWLDCGKQSVRMFEASGASSLARAVLERHEDLNQQLLEHGALLFRGFVVDGVAPFSEAIDALSPTRMDYRYGTSPRSVLGDRIYTSTEHPASQTIELHNECSCQTIWPLKIAFCCVTPAAEGGETPIADIRQLTAGLDRDLVRKFSERGVRYVRNYRPHVDVPWQKVFQTNDRSRVAELCAQRGMEHVWTDANTLRTTQLAQGGVRHPVSGEWFFFNQAHLFHISSLGAEASFAMLNIFGLQGLPKHATFADAEEIPLAELDEVRAVFRANTISFSWRQGDVLLLDNLRFAHGRNPFKGARQVLTAMMEPHGAVADAGRSTLQ